MNIFNPNFPQQIADIEGSYYLKMMRLPCYIGQENGLFNSDGSLNQKGDRILHNCAGIPKYKVLINGEIREFEIREFVAA